MVAPADTHPKNHPSIDASLTWRDLLLWLGVIFFPWFGILVMGFTALALPVGVAFLVSMSLYGLLTWALRPTVVDREERPRLWSLLLAFRFGSALVPIVFFVAMCVISSLPFAWPVLLAASLLVPMGMMLCQAFLRTLCWDPMVQAHDTTASERRFALWMGADLSLCETLVITRVGGARETVKIGGSVESCALPSPKTIESVEILPGVTSIGTEAFRDCSILSSVQIPSSVTSIGDGAFLSCTTLRSVEIPSDVTSIGSYTFSGCTSLRSVVIPSDVTSIGSYTFRGCTSLRSVVIPSDVTSIGSYTFSGCTSLRSVVIPSSVTSIGNGAFFDCRSLGSVVIPEGVTSIGMDAFYACRSLGLVVIPFSVTSIGVLAFRNCTSLSSVEIPEGVTSIGDGAFRDCTRLGSVVIPSSVTSIGNGAFFDCRSLGSVAIPSGVTCIRAKTFSGCTSLGSVVIPEGVTSIGMDAFYACRSLGLVVIPFSVTSIHLPAFAGVGDCMIVCNDPNAIDNGDWLPPRAVVVNDQGEVLIRPEGMNAPTLPSAFVTWSSEEKVLWWCLYALPSDEARVAYAKAHDISFEILSQVWPSCAESIEREILSGNAHTVDLCLLRYLGCADIANLKLALMGPGGSEACNRLFNGTVILCLQDHARAQLLQLLLELARYSKPERAVDMLYFMSCLDMAASMGLHPERHRRSVWGSRGYQDYCVKLMFWSDRLEKGLESVDVCDATGGDDGFSSMVCYLPGP